MPEVILPCPACGNEESIVVTQSMASNRFRMFCICGHTGRFCDTQQSALEAWNALPRAMTWTHEPPVEAGWYWRKETAADRAHVFHFTGNWEDYGERWKSDRVCQLPLILNDNLWAGPIPAPID